MRKLASNLNQFRPAIQAAGFFVFILTFSACFGKRAELSGRPIVQVNNSSLLAKDFAELLAHRLKDFDALTVKDKKTLSQVREQLINNFIIEAVTRDWATDKGIFVRREDLEAKINSIRSHYPDDLTFRHALSEQNLSFDQWKERIKFSLLQKLVLRKLTAAMKPLSSQQLKNYYQTHKDKFQLPERVRIRQVVLNSESNAKHIYQEVRKGRSIKELAAKYSIAPEAENGGDIGWITRGTLDIFDAAFSMRVGKKSEVVKSPYGYHIFEVTGKKQGSVQPLKEIKDNIRRQFRAKAEQKAYSSWLEARLRAARVMRDDNLIDAIAVETKDE